MTPRVKDQTLLAGTVALFALVNLAGVATTLRSIHNELPPPDADVGPGAGMGATGALTLWGLFLLPLANLFLVLLCIVLRRSLRHWAPGRMMTFASIIVLIGFAAVLTDTWMLWRMVSETVNGP